MNLISLSELSGSTIEEIVNFAVEYKKSYKKYADALKGKTLLMLFEKTSTRTRISFESGFNLLGGHSIYLNIKDSNMMISDLRDEVRYVSSNVDIIMARMLKNEDLLTLRDFSRVPVINGCCNLYHPCQILSDLLTIKEEFSTVKGISVLYVGIRNNICNELISGITKLGGTFYQITPLKEYNCVIPHIDEEAKKTNLWHEEANFAEVLKKVDIVYSDTWIDMEYFLDSKYENKRKAVTNGMMPYQLNAAIFDINPKLKVMHDMPMHAGMEITRDVIEHKNSIIFRQAENRMWAQNALILKLSGYY